MASIKIVSLNHKQLKISDELTDRVYAQESLKWLA
jgi:hypothetical protein